MTEKIGIKDNDALIVVDVQNDFLPGGSMGVKDGDAVVPVINLLLPMFTTRVFTRDWHPEDHVSFSSEPEFTDMSWPPHAVRGTWGAEFHPDLKVPEDAVIVSKAPERDKEAYSGFQATDLARQLGDKGAKRVFVGGVATDYCVKFTVQDALKEGFETYVIVDACRAVDVPEGNGQAALDDMEKQGAKLVNSSDLE
ncbi:MAG: nicotinamidase [bacterium]